MYSRVKEGCFQEEEDSLRVFGISERAGLLWPRVWDGGSATWGGTQLWETTQVVLLR